MAFVACATEAEGYLSIRPDVTPESAASLGCRMLQRIKRKYPWARLLESAGLGEVRLLRELEARLNAMTTRFYQEKLLGDFEDNATRMRAAELLSDLLNKRKTSIDLHAGEITIRQAPTPEQLARLSDDELKTLDDLVAKMYAESEDGSPT